MTLSLKDIIDLDFLLGLDESAEDVDTIDIVSRDREIFRQMKDGESLGDARLIAGWLASRRLLFLEETENSTRHPAGDTLPGAVFDSFYTWIARGVFFCSLAAGGMSGYSFLAYHGNRPVNVTLFIVMFILFPALLCLTAAAVGCHQFRVGPARSGWLDLPHRLFMRLFNDKFMERLQKWAAPVQTRLSRFSGNGAAKNVATILHLDSQPFRRILFWPMFILLSLGALGFSAGVLWGTVFRVMVTDLAFGWQSTLLSSGERVHDLVTWIALPWSWIMPDMFVPTLEQIEGSRIILKEGISGLSSNHLAAWWPFLCMGMLVYALIPRIALLGFAHAAKGVILARFDLSRPGYQRLLMRMRTPRMGMSIRETGGSRTAFRAPLPRPAPGGPGAKKDEADIIMSQFDAVRTTAVTRETPEKKPEVVPEERMEKRPETLPEALPEATETRESDPQRPVAVGSPEAVAPADAPQPQTLPDTSCIKNNMPGALVLGSVRGLEANDRAQIRAGLEQQFGIHITNIIGVHFDFDEDQDQIAAHVGALGKGPVIVFQEVWQPPIRGLLYYFVQLRETFPETPLWIVMTQTTGPGEKNVASSDVNFQVWKSAVNQLNDPRIIIERWMLP